MLGTGTRPCPALLLFYKLYFDIFFVMPKRSTRPVIPFEEILRPFVTTFPVTIEGSVNRKTFTFRKGEKVRVSKEAYTAIAHSSYAPYLGH